MKRVAIAVTLLSLVVIGWFGWQRFSQPPETEPPSQINEPVETGPAKYSGQWYVDLLNAIELPNTQPITEPPAITGNKEADAQIRQVAEGRGYELQSIPTPNINVKVFDKIVAQPVVEKPWGELKAAAQKEAGVKLGLISGYRSPDTQKEIFLNQLDAQARDRLGRPYTNEEIADGEADEVINKILSEYSIPGYSRHHSGYALDVTDAGSGKPFEQFAATKGYEWLKKDDYANARRFGFVPSYPEGVENQGASAEPWEYVYVGREHLQ